MRRDQEIEDEGTFGRWSYLIHKGADDDDCDDDDDNGDDDDGDGHIRGWSCLIHIKSLLSEVGEGGRV